MTRRKRSDYGRGHALHVNIRLRKIGEKPTRKEVAAVLDYMISRGKVPKGWEFAIIEWTHVRDASRGWRRGNIRDLRGPLTQALDYLAGHARIGIDQSKSRGNVWEIEIAMETGV